MFRVYMSRAEINKQNRQRKAAHLRQRFDLVPAAGKANEMAKLRSPGGSGEALIEAEDADSASSRDQLVCVTKMGFYSVMFAMISLTLLVVSLMSIGWFVTRANRTKFHIGTSSLSDAMF